MKSLKMDGTNFNARPNKLNNKNWPNILGRQSTSCKQSNIQYFFGENAIQSRFLRPWI